MDQPDDVAAIVECLRPYHDAFRPLFGSKEGSGGRRLEGTATVVHDGDHRFIITAHHAVSQPTPYSIGVREAATMPWPSGFFVLEPREESLPAPDLAFAHGRVSGSDSGLEGGFPVALAMTSQPESAKTVYLAVGYPASKGKVRMGAGTAEAKLQIALVGLASSEQVESVKADSRVHLCFTYSQSGRTNLLGEPVTGAHPQGMSGGAVIAIGKARNQQSGPTYAPFLVGILTQFHEARGVLVAARLRNLWQAIGVQQSSQAPLFRAVGA